MTVKQLKQDMVENGNDVYFTYKSKRAGIEFEVREGIFSFEVWWGDKRKKYTHIDDVLTDTFFDGKSVADLINDVQIEYV